VSATDQAVSRAVAGPIDVPGEVVPGPVAVDAVGQPSLTRLPGLRARKAGSGRTWTLWAGVGLLGLLVLVAIALPSFLPDPIDQDIPNALSGPTGAHWLGTDHLGRDVLSRLLHSARLDLLVGVTAVIAPFVIGTFLGLVAGYAGGIVSTVIMRLADVMMAFPYYVLVIALVFVIGPGLGGIYAAVAIVVWSSYARIIHGEVLAVTQSDYVRAARAGGLGHARVMFRHVLPNSISQSIVYSTSDVVIIILGVVTLSFLGLGVTPPTPEWGAMISDARPFVQTHPLLLVAPGIAVMLTGLAFSLIGDGLATKLRVGGGS
jgi:peptide/nickel transport system permease protein